MSQYQPPKRQNTGIDLGQNNVYNEIYKAFLNTIGVRNDELVEWVQEANLPYSKSLYSGWRQNPDNPKRYRLMRLEELAIMTELVRRKTKGLPVDDLAARVTLKGYSKGGTTTDGTD